MNITIQALILIPILLMLSYKAAAVVESSPLLAQQTVYAEQAPNDTGLCQDYMGVFPLSNGTLQTCSLLTEADCKTYVEVIRICPQTCARDKKGEFDIAPNTRGSCELATPKSCYDNDRIRGYCHKSCNTCLVALEREWRVSEGNPEDTRRYDGHYEMFTEVKITTAEAR